MKMLMFALILMAPALRAGQATGDVWRRWDELARLAYLQGVEDAHVSTDAYYKFFPKTKTEFASLMAAIDEFFTEPANRPLGVPAAMRITAKRFNGSSKWCLEFLTVFERTLLTSTFLNSPKCEGFVEFETRLLRRQVGPALVKCHAILQVT